MNSADEPDYESYTLDELYDARGRIDRDNFPERFDRLEREIERRKAGGTPVGRDDDESSRKASVGLTGRRLIGFALDYMILSILWLIVDNLLFFPVPGWLLIALSFGLFVGYFAVTENLISGGASPGKGAMGTVVDGESRISVARGLVRAALVAMIWWVEWDEFLMLDLFAGWPEITIAIVLGLQIGLVLYNLALFQWVPPLGHLLPDRLTNTHVRLRESEREGQSADGTRWLSVGALIGSLLVGLAVSVGFSAAASSVLGDPVASLFNPIGETAKNSRIFVAAIEADTSIRVRAATEKIRTWSADEPTRTTLSVKVWIPAAKWAASNREKVIQSAVAQLRVKPGEYDRGQIVVWTGGDSIKWAETSSLNLP